MITIKDVQRNEKKTTTTTTKGKRKRDTWSITLVIEA